MKQRSQRRFRTGGRSCDSGAISALERFALRSRFNAPRPHWKQCGDAPPSKLSRGLCPAELAFRPAERERQPVHGLLPGAGLCVKCTKVKSNRRNDMVADKKQAAAKKPAAAKPAAKKPAAKKPAAKKPAAKK